MDNVTVKRGISTTSLVGVIFLVCKLFGVINWSWWLVLLPFYGPAALAIIIVLICAIAGAIFIKD